MENDRFQDMRILAGARVTEDAARALPRLDLDCQHMQNTIFKTIFLPPASSRTAQGGRLANL